MRAVLDASAGLAAVLGARGGDAILERLADAASVVAPDLYAAEVANALWKYVSAGEVEVEEAGLHLESALALVDRFVPGAPMAQEALREAAAFRHPVYDLMYAITARREGCTVLTADRRLQKLLSKLGVPFA